MFKPFARMFPVAAALASSLLLVSPPVPALAAGSSLSHTASTGSVVDGGTVDLTATAPLYGAGTAVRWLQEKVDPNVVHLTSPSQIKAPEGWKVRYSTDGVAFTATTPATPQAWSEVRAVRAQGVVSSDGVVNGRQAITTTQSVSSPAIPPTNISPSPGGDGWDAVFSPSGQVYNWNHHMAGARIECHETSTGADCPTPSLGLYGVVSQFRSFEYLNTKTQRIWMPEMSQFDGTPGFVCVNIAGGSLSSAGCEMRQSPAASPWQWYAATVGFTHVGQKIYAMTANGRLMCLDTAADGGKGLPCPGQPYGTSNPAILRSSSLVSIGNEVIGVNLSGAFCVDAATDAPCLGWTAPTTMTWPAFAQVAGTSDSYPIYGWLQPATSGSSSAACFMAVDNTPHPLATNQVHCLNASGQEVQSTSGSAFAGILATQVVRGNDLNNDNAPTNVGTRMYEIIPGGEARLPAKVICFDAATARTCGGMWTDVSNLPGSGWVYSIKQDPYRPDCLYVVTHDSGIFPLSATTGMRGCKASQPSETVSFTGLTPRLGCDAGQGSWASFSLSQPTLGATGDAAAATLDVNGTDGTAIPGWQGVTIPATGIVDLRQLPEALTGPRPTFTVHVNGRTPFSDATVATLTSLGNSPQLCISPAISYTCPDGYDAIPTLPNAIATILATDDTAVAPGVGVDVTVRPATPQTCTGSVAGTVLDTSGNPVPGLRVSIADASGAPVQLDGSPYTVSTKADGTYSFPGLRPDLAYVVTFPDTSVATAVSATVPSGDGAGTTTATGGSVTSNAAGVTAGATTIVDALYTQLIDLTPDAEVVPKNTTTTLHPLANDEPATGNTLVASSVKLCGLSEAPPACTQSSVTVTEGTFVANPDGTVDFTPATDYTGVVTPVTYQASDTGPTTGSAEINVTVVGAPTAQPVTSIDDVNVAQTLTPLSGATVDPAAGWALTPLLLCGASESAGSCTQSSVSVDGVGIYTVTPDNEVSFVPEHNYVGSPTPVTFDVVDAIGQRASSTLAVTVRPTIPEVPSSPSVTAGTTSATVSFDVPAWDGGSPVLSYLVEDGPGKHSCTVTVSGPGPYSCTVTGLVPGKVYGFVITATNAVGTGPEAAVSTRVGVLACTPGTYVEQRLGLLQSTTDFTTWTTLGQENGFVNAIAYRPADGFLYGIGTASRDLTGPENHLMRVAGDGSVTDLGVVEGLPATRAEAKFPAGAFDPFTGHLVVGGRGHLYSIDVDTHRATAIALPDGVSRIGWDLVIEGEWLWTVTSTQVVGINLSTDESVSYDLPGDYQSHGYGSVWPGTDDSSMFFQSNATGDITKVTGLGSSPSFSKVGSLPSAPRNDGAACPGAPS